MEKQEEQSKSEISPEKVRAERDRARENEVGYKLGKSMGNRLRSTTAIMLPIQMALAPLLLTLGGYYLDASQGTSPGFTLGGLVFGLAVAVLTLVRYVKEQQD